MSELTNITRLTKQNLHLHMSKVSTREGTIINVKEFFFTWQSGIVV